VPAALSDQPTILLEPPILQRSAILNRIESFMAMHNNDIQTLADKVCAMHHEISEENSILERLYKDLN
jgi:hypothetical protein